MPLGATNKDTEGKGWARARRVERLAATARENVAPYLAPALQTVLGYYSTVGLCLPRVRRSSDTPDSVDCGLWGGAHVPCAG